MTGDYEKFLKIKLSQLRSGFVNPEREKVFEHLYEGIFDSETQVAILSGVHSKLNELFSFMNDKNHLGVGGHFNAYESRILIELIKQVELIKANTKDSESYSFTVDSYYQHVLNRCNKFLSKSGGSTIPDDFDTIDLIENKPIFIKNNVTSIRTVYNYKSASIKQIGTGSYASVFEYVDPHYQTKFALKRAKKDLRSDELKRFKLEYDYLNKFDSPYIIKVYNFSDTLGEYTMEFVDQTLQEYYRYNNDKLTWKDRWSLLNQLLSAFEYIHSKRILHRDISFQNILIKQYEDRAILKVADFGLVKIEESDLTRKGTEVKGAINDYSDLSVVGFENYEIIHETYALSKVIYFILTGKSSNYHREENKALKEFILKGIGDKRERFKNVEEMRSYLVSNVKSSLVSS